MCLASPNIVASASVPFQHHLLSAASTHTLHFACLNLGNASDAVCNSNKNIACVSRYERYYLSTKLYTKSFVTAWSILLGPCSSHLVSHLSSLKTTVSIACIRRRCLCMFPGEQWFKQHPTKDFPGFLWSAKERGIADSSGQHNMQNLWWP